MARFGVYAGDALKQETPTGHPKANTKGILNADGLAISKHGIGD